MANQNGSIRVIVTQDDIDFGVPGSVSKCPVARAVQRVVGFQHYVEVYGADVIIDNALYLGGKVVLEFVDRFDKWRTVDPFEFNMTRIGLA